MSSILDALNKLEQEKTQAARDSEQAELDPAITAHDLVGRSMLRDRVTLRVTPAALLLSIGALVVTLIVVGFAAIVLLMRSGDKPTDQVAANTPAATPGAVELVAPQATPMTEAPVVAPPPSNPATAPQPSASETTVAPVTVTAPPPQSSTTQPEVTAPPPAPMPSPTVVARQPDTKPEATTPQAEPPLTPPTSAGVTPAPQPSTGDSERDVPDTINDNPAPRTRMAIAPIDDEDEPAPLPVRRPPAPKSTAVVGKDVELARLPIFTESDQMRYGFDRITINMMKPADSTNPQGSAILSFAETAPDGSTIRNRMRFYEGQRIQQSPLRMFKVEEGRVGIEDVRTGDRYQLEF